MSPLLPAVLAGLTVLLLLPPTSRWRPGSGGVATGSSSGSTTAGTSGAWRLTAAVGAGVGAWTFLGGSTGLVLAVPTGLGLWWWLGRLEPPAVQRRREELRRQLPATVDLVAACLDAGGAPGPALRTVGAALGGPVSEVLARCCRRLDLGGDPASVWEELSAHPELGPLGRTFARAHESGSSVSEAVHHLAEDLREASRAEVEARARRLEVKVALPLGLCLLPAFVLLGIVPMVVGLFGSIRLL